MKKSILVVILFLAVLGPYTPSLAQDTKIITLTDGSVLKGNVLELKDGIYTIGILQNWQDESGQAVAPLKIPESSIKSIVTESAATQASTTTDGKLKDKAAQLQGQLMADKGIMEDINQLANQEDIQKLLSDPQLLNDVMSMDPDKIQNNEKVQELINNPEVQKLMLQIQQKYQTP